MEKDTENKVRELLAGIVAPALETQKSEITESVKSLIQEQLAELKKPAENPLKIEGGEDNLSKDPKGGFKCLSYFARDVATVGKTGGRKISKELSNWEKVVKAAGTGMEEGDNEFGGYLIPPEFRMDIMQHVEQKNELLPLCMPVMMQTNIIEMPYVEDFDESSGYVYGGIEWKWLDELAQKSETRPKIGKITLKLKKLAGLCYASDEVLSDSPMSMEGFLKKGFADGLNFQINKVLVRGTGAGQPLGVLNAPAKYAVSAEAGQAASTILFENIIKMYAASFNPSASVWVANPNTLPQLCTMSLSVGTGGVPVFMPANGAAGVPYNTLFGRPIYFNDQASTLGTEGDLMLIDFSQYMFARKAGAEGVMWDTSMHLKFDWNILSN